MIKFLEVSFEEKLWDSYAKRGLYRDQLNFGSPKAYRADITANYSGMLPSNGEPLLDPNKFYMITMDQSTSCSGITVKSIDNTHVILMEVKKDSGDKSAGYIYKLEDLLDAMCDGANIAALIYERPVIRHFQSTRVLFQLDGMLKNLPMKHPQFSATQIDQIPVSSWRACVLPHQGKGEDLKLKVKQALLQKYDWLQLYGASIGTDNDVFDSIGILTGWMNRGYDTLGRAFDPNKVKRMPIEAICCDMELTAQFVEELGFGSLAPVVYSGNLESDLRLMNMKGADDFPVLIAPDNDTMKKMCASFGVNSELINKDVGELCFIHSSWNGVDICDYLQQALVNLGFTDYASAIYNRVIL